MLEDNIEVQSRRAGFGCNNGYFTGSTRRTSIFLFLWATAAATVVISSELWRILDPKFYNNWKEDRENNGYSADKSQYVLDRVLGMFVASTLPFCVYCGAAQMNKGLIHLFSGYSMICSFFTFIATFQYFVLCDKYYEHLAQEYCYLLGALELLTFVTFLMSCSHSLTLIRQTVTFSSDNYEEDQTSPQQPQQETFSSYYTSWMTTSPQQPQPGGSTISNQNSGNYPTATATVVGVVPTASSDIEMATVTAEPVPKPTVDQTNAAAASLPYTTATYVAPVSSTVTHYPQDSSIAGPSEQSIQMTPNVQNINTDQGTANSTGASKSSDPNFVTRT